MDGWMDGLDGWIGWIGWWIGWMDGVCDVLKKIWALWPSKDLRLRCYHAVLYVSTLLCLLVFEEDTSVATTAWNSSSL